MSRELQGKELLPFCGSDHRSLGLKGEDCLESCPQPGVGKYSNAFKISVVVNRAFKLWVWRVVSSAGPPVVAMDMALSLEAYNQGGFKSSWVNISIKPPKKR